MLEPQEPPPYQSNWPGGTTSSPTSNVPATQGSPPAIELAGMSPGALDLFSDDAFDEAEPPKPWYRRTGWIAVVAVVLVVALIVGGLAFIRRNQTTQVSYAYATVRSGTLAVIISATGPLQAATYAANFSVSGKLAEIDVQVGQQVSVGQQLAKLDTTALQDALNQAQAAANTAYDNEQAAIAKCNQEGSAAPPFCVQTAQDQYNQALAQLQTAQDNLAAATLYAPHAGVVGQINGSVGNSPGTGSSGSGSSASSSTGGASGFIVIEDTSVFQITANVNEADIANLAVGQSATFTLTAYTGKTFTGKVTQILPFGTTSSNVVTYPVTIAVDMSSLGSAKLFPGMTATLSIIRAQRTNTLLIPSTAISFARSALTSGLVPISAGSSSSSSASSSGSTSATAGISASDLRNALTQARQMLTSYEQQNTNYADDNPTAAFVLETSGSGRQLQWSVKPVVIGLTDGTNYEALAGLGQGDRVVTGQSGGTTTGSNTGRGGIFGGGGLGGGGNGGRGGGGTGGGGGGNGGNGGNGQGGGGG